MAPGDYRKHQHKRRPRLALTHPEDTDPVRRTPYSPIKATSIKEGCEIAPESVRGVNDLTSKLCHGAEKSFEIGTSSRRASRQESGNVLLLKIRCSWPELFSKNQDFSSTHNALLARMGVLLP